VVAMLSIFRFHFFHWLLLTKTHGAIDVNRMPQLTKPKKVRLVKQWKAEFLGRFLGDVRVRLLNNQHEPKKWVN